MNRIAKIAVLLVALTVAFSFSQESSSVTEEKPIYRIISDSVTIEALTKSQEFYNTAFNNIMTLLTIVVTFGLASGVWSWWSNKIQIDENLKKEKGENEKKFNGAYKKIAEMYYISARDELFKVNESKNEEYKNEHWFNHFMRLASFYYILFNALTCSRERFVIPITSATEYPFASILRAAFFKPLTSPLDSPIASPFSLA
jgi:hypothetical protein